jgi:type VI protein secretion system component VasA
VLNHFLSMYISINSFSSLTANTSERKARALEPWSWPLQIGNRPPV